MPNKHYSSILVMLYHHLMDVSKLLQYCSYIVRFVLSNISRGTRKATQSTNKSTPCNLIYTYDVVHYECHYLFGWYYLIIVVGY